MNSHYSDKKAATSWQSQQPILWTFSYIWRNSNGIFVSSVMFLSSYTRWVWDGLIFENESITSSSFHSFLGHASSKEHGDSVLTSTGFACFRKPCGIVMGCPQPSLLPLTMIPAQAIADAASAMLHPSQFVHFLSSLPVATTGLAAIATTYSQRPLATAIVSFVVRYHPILLLVVPGWSKVVRLEVAG